MFYLKKCAKEGCKRFGSVALKEGDKFCNLHKNGEKRDEKGHFKGEEEEGNE